MVETRVKNRSVAEREAEAIVMEADSRNTAWAGLITRLCREGRLSDSCVPKDGSPEGTLAAVHAHRESTAQFAQLRTLDRNAHSGLTPVIEIETVSAA